MNVTFTLNEQDTRVLRQQIDAWMANPQASNTANAETRESLQRIAEQFRYLTAGQEQTQRARG